ncbi:hypothetical protein [Methanobacterium sp.]|uniref:hypothetical protein n=1 Tax=Methanobacterium sp. TaxID=2164 RepID=UPI003C74D70D
MLNKYDVDPSWRVIVLDYDEWWTYNESRNHFNKYKDEFIEKGDVVEEYDYEINTLKAIGHCIPCLANKDNMEFVKEQLDQKRLKNFNFETKFIQRLFNSYNVDHLILLNEEEFSMLLNIQRPVILTHEAYHIIEYELYDQNHKYEEVQHNATKLAQEYIESFTEDQRKKEFKNICSHRKGRGKYGRLRLITKFNNKKLDFIY